MTLEAPIKRVANRRLDEAAVARIWRSLASPRARTGASPRLLMGFAGAIAAVAALVLFSLSLRVSKEPGPLRLRGGGELATLQTDVPAEDSSTELEDGSHISMAPHGRLLTLANTSTSVVALLATGRATFDVTPGGPRRWSIECGFATVEVVGTRFIIERSEKRLHVEVERGVVLVRGELVKDRVARLTAGESLDLEEATSEPHESRAAAEPSPPSSSASPSVPAVVSATPRTPAPLADDARPRWRPLAEKGAYREAYDALTPDGLARQSQGASVEDLLLLADVARLSGHPADAVAPLELAIRAHRGAQSSVAAFTLGRIRLDALGQAGPAADAFSQALALGLSDALREDAYARIVEARARAGDRAGARAAADDYLARYPAGRRLAEVSAWAERP